MLGVGGFFVYVKLIHPSTTPTIETPLQNTQNVSCTEGIDGNSGDNFCSNYHNPASKCQPGFPDNFADGCTQGS